MKRLLIVPAVMTFLAVGFTLPSEIEARNNSCTIKATKDVNLQAHYLRGSSASESPRAKSEVIWSGSLRRGESQAVTASRGKVLVTYQDLTKDRARPTNRSANCQNGNVILVPR